MTADDLATAWSNIERAVLEHATFQPGALDASVWDAVAAGKVHRLQGAEGVRGVGVLKVSRAAAWLSLTDDTPVNPPSGLTQAAWGGSWAGSKYLYQHLDLPWPFQDRHWVSYTQTNVHLGTLGVWERNWRNAPEQLPAARSKTDGSLFDTSLGIPVNRGSWMLVSLSPNETLGVYQARVQLGGELPEGAADKYASVSLPDFFRSIELNANSMYRRYVSNCVQPGGDGVPIPCLD